MNQKAPVSESPALLHLCQQLESLKISDYRLCRMMNIETWAIVDTMDDFVPGFWSRYMVNRQIALQAFLEQKKAKSS